MSLIMSSKRGDTLIEVMFAFAIFSLVAILTFAMMDSGLAKSERALEQVTTRSEINAQAEAIRFIYNAYTAESTLPVCTTELINKGEKCQQYTALWNQIIAGAKFAYDPTNPMDDANINFEFPLTTCESVYNVSAGSSGNLLAKSNAFIINTREINYIDNANAATAAYLSANAASTASLFQPAELSPRIIYILPSDVYSDEDTASSISGALSTNLLYRKVARIEGIWAVAVKSKTGTTIGHDFYPDFYDFYIQSCWYGSGDQTPTTQDTVIRLYNGRTN